MFKLVRQSEIDDYKTQIIRLKLELCQVRNDFTFYKSSQESRGKTITVLEDKLRGERRARELAEASVKALEDHLRVLNETKK